MNPKNLSVRLDPNTGDIWLFDDSKRRRFKNITTDIMYVLCSDPHVQPHGKSGAVREITFTEPDGSKWEAIFKIETRKVSDG